MEIKEIKLEIINMLSNIDDIKIINMIKNILVGVNKKRLGN